MNAERDYAAEERMRGAAKEMYEALLWIVRDASYKAPEQMNELTIIYVRKAAAALAKAEGKS